MQFPKSLHAEGWHAHLPHLRLFHARGDVRSPRSHRGLHIAAAVLAVTALTASVGLAAVDDPRSLDVQLTSAMHNAGESLAQWQGQLSNGLQVSLRAVADGRDTPARTVKTLVAEAAPAVSAEAASAARH
jgi:phage tail protein X